MKKTIRIGGGAALAQPIKDMGSGEAAPQSGNQLTQIKAALEKTGLVILAAFHPGPDDDIPIPAGASPAETPIPAGASRAETVVLAGNGGGSMWRSFELSRPAGAHPLDKWSTETFKLLAARFGAHPVLPHDGPPYAPFQRWALRSGQVHQSPIGILIHAKYGLWHSYRGAFIFAQRLALPPAEGPTSPCSSCEEKPCLSACPVEAFRPGSYDLKRCVAHVGEIEGQDCQMSGCRARRACPVGREYVYLPAQAQFHMAAFLKTHGKHF
ncbi:MAG: hypothetical protein O3B21_10955 [Proteobacteria bacterium]|nr:hypothetical protein [Pseudomonadota bacterium]MDA1357576.1 hypothetical protein [Pseudomonadota bacterium]